MNNQDKNAPKEQWIKPELNTFNKKDFVKSNPGGVGGGEDGGCYKTGS